MTDEELTNLAWMSEAPPGPECYNEAIWKWTLTMTPDKWYAIAPKNMSKEEFTNCIKYLICIGEPLLFTNDYSAFKREEPPNFDFMAK